MAVILAYGSPALGHLYPMGALLRELRERGHQVHLRTLAGEVASMRGFGMHAEAVDPRIEAIIGRDWLGGHPLGGLKTTIDGLCRRAVIEVDDLGRALTRVRPDAVIVDANCWGAMSMAEASGVPWLVFSPFTPYLRSRGAPPFGPGLRPLPGRQIVPRTNAIRAELGIPPVRSVDALMRRAALLLAVGGEPFEYSHPDWPAAHFIGACVFEPASAPVPGWLAAIDRPIVLGGTSSIAQGDAGLGGGGLAARARG